MKKSEKFNNTLDLAWNPRVPHIIAASSDSGSISIIDLRFKKEITSIVLPGSGDASSIAWSPEIVILSYKMLKFMSLLAYKSADK